MPGVESPELSVRWLASGVSERLQAVEAVGEQVWASGVAATLVRSNGNADVLLPTAAMTESQRALQFRDLEVLSSERALALASGEGAASQLWSTDDGGQIFTVVLENQEPEGFWDCLDFWRDGSGFLYGDSVNGSLTILTTDDAGRSWTEARSLPPALAGEGGFAASGTCAVASQETVGLGWIVTGAAERPRVLRTEDGGQSWQAFEVPWPGKASATSGLTTAAFVDDDLGFAGGGDVADSESFSWRLLASRDGGRQWVDWSEALEPPFPGAIFGLDAVRRGDEVLLVAVGPGGAAWAEMPLGEKPRSWNLLSDQALWAVDLITEPLEVEGSYLLGFVVGPEGRLGQIER